MGVTGHDLMDESGSPVRQMLRLGFGYSKFRFAVSESSDWKLEDLDGKKIATSYPRLVRAHLAGKRISAQIVKLDGAVEISIQLGLADAIADVVSSGRTLRQHHLKVIGDPIAESEATLIEREPRNDRRDSLDTKGEKSIFLERLRGVVYARQYLMLDYDCPESQLPAAEKLTPGLTSPTVAPLARKGWVAVRAMVRTNEANLAMDRLAAIGCTAILTSLIRSCRAVDGRNGDENGA
jgi:ATP phosphoribosyltransferase